MDDAGIDADTEDNGRPAARSGLAAAAAAAAAASAVLVGALAKSETNRPAPPGTSAQRRSWKKLLKRVPAAVLDEVDAVTGADRPDTIAGRTRSRLNAGASKGPLVVPAATHSDSGNSSDA
jgi:hypothetical protein